MTQLNFEGTNDHEADIRAMARDDYDEYEDRLDFADALNRRGLDARLQQAIDEMGEDEAAELYEETFNEIEEEGCSSY